MALPQNCKCNQAKAKAELLADQTNKPPMMMARYIGESTPQLRGPVTGFGYGRADSGKILKVFSVDADGEILEPLYA